MLLLITPPPPFYFFQKQSKQKQGKSILDRKLNNEVDYVHEQIKAYMAIVKRTARDMVPKAVKLYIIDELKNFIHTKLLTSLTYPTENLVSRTVKQESITQKNLLCSRRRFVTDLFLNFR